MLSYESEDSIYFTCIKMIRGASFLFFSYLNIYRILHMFVSAHIYKEQRKSCNTIANAVTMFFSLLSHNA